jgi:hypothetical protein
MIWRPNFDSEFGTKDFFATNFTTRRSHSSILAAAQRQRRQSRTSSTGIFLGAAYTQTSTIVSTARQHLNRGLANVPQTQSHDSVCRVWAQSHDHQSGASSRRQRRNLRSQALPFRIGGPDGQRGFSCRGDLLQRRSRTPLAPVSAPRKLFGNPSLFPVRRDRHQTMPGTTVLVIGPKRASAPRARRRGASTISLSWSGRGPASRVNKRRPRQYFWIEARARPQRP